jgi:drug/metabolite transporter (DMT)-like permease
MQAIWGMILSALAFVFFTSFDTLAKYLSADYSVFQIMAVSYTAGTVMLLAYTVLKHKQQTRTVLTIHRPELHVARGITQIVGQTCAYLALPHVSLAQFYVIIFTMPIIVVLVTSLTLKEKISFKVWAVLFINFIGVLIAVRPDQDMSIWTLVLCIGTFVLGCSLVLLRKMMATESSELTSITTIAALAAGAIVPALFIFQSMSMTALGWMLLGGVFCALSQILLSNAFRLAPAAYASPPQFLQLIYGAVAGYLVFGDVPSHWVYIGGLIVIIANVYLIVQQQMSQKQ